MEHKIYNKIKSISKFCGYLDTPIGVLEFLADEKFLLSVMILDGEKKITENKNEIIKNSISQFKEYFSGQRKNFEIPTKFHGTDFQNKVWSELLKIPYGETISYKEQSIQIENEKACRAVGGANGKNIYTILAPCHRVIGENGKLTGYAGGLNKKEWLLEHEKKCK
ncbi:MAG: methylated-DNA--[protein]-cysteine S-methyltransferase [Fusobacteriaceae bacterium]